MVIFFVGNIFSYLNSSTLTLFNLKQNNFLLFLYIVSFLQIEDFIYQKLLKIYIIYNNNNLVNNLINTIMMFFISFYNN